jgi:tetratricopeptide (TPR) repeat protein
LRSAAQPAAALAAVQSLIDAHELSPLDIARALDLEGICYEDMGEREKAIQALEEAQRLLGAKDSDELGAVLDNLGRMYAANGDLGRAARLYERAFRIAEGLGNHSAMARVINNQADIALKRGHKREARKYLQRVDEQAKQAPELDDDLLATIASMKGWLALKEGDTRVALKDNQEALRLWKEAHGERHPLTAWGLILWEKRRRRMEI